MSSENEATCKVGVLTISDRAFTGVYEDRGGPAIHKYLETHFEQFDTESRVVPDDQVEIEQAMKELTSTCSLVLSTGGTGCTPRDVTPEATEAVCHKMVPGFGEVMRAVSFKIVPTAILSRQTAGICNTSLIINLPGNPKAIAECLDPVLQAIPHAVKHAGGTQSLILKPEFIKKKTSCGACCQH